MHDEMREIFDTLLADEPPIGVTAAGVRQRGRQRLHRRRMLVAAGSAVAVGLTGSAAIAYGPGHGLLTASPATSGSSSATASGEPAPTDTASTPATPVYEIPQCSGERIAKSLSDTDGSVLPDPAKAAQAVLTHAATFAPGRTFRLVSAERVDASEQSGGAPRVSLIFDVVHGGGTGSINLEVLPQTGMSATERATIDQRAKPLSNCTPATRTDFSDGGVGLEYTAAFGTGDPNNSVQHTWYYSPSGFDINAGAFLTPWSQQVAPSTSGPYYQHGAPSPMPLTSAEMLAACRVVASA
jgi:hypothetical protein